MYHLELSKCYRSLDVSHIAKFCAAKVETYSHCGEERHKKEFCPNKNKPMKFGLYRRTGKPLGNGIVDRERGTYR